MKKYLAHNVLIAVMLLFLLISIITLIPHTYQDKSQKRSDILVKSTTREGNTEKIEYLDAKGTVTMAADRGYAAIIRIKEKTYWYEHFYDEKGQPIKIYPGYYALYREFDDAGQNVHITYLDQNDKPVMTREGYSDKYFTFYDNGKIRTEKYYDNLGNPVCTTAYGYGFLDLYNEKEEKYKTIYLDEEDHPMVTGLGYAIIHRKFYENGLFRDKVESEFYYDENEKPTALSLGQYGVHKEYDTNGHESVLTYLDAKGNMIITNKGYTTVVKTFHANNTVATERYFDIEGNPFSLTEGQYGIKKEEDQIVYLDNEGKETFNLKRVLFNQSWIIIPVVIVIILLSVKLNRKGNSILLFLYCLAIIYLTLLFREKIEIKDIGLLGNYNGLFTNSEVRIEIIRNIWLFIPLGALIYKLCPNNLILIIPIIMSCMIEVTQLITRNGYCDIYDLISNSVGGVLGFYIEKTLTRINKRELRKI